MTEPVPAEPGGREREFLRFLVSHEIRLRAFALSLIPNWADAEEVLQEANLILWRKFGQFQPGTDFFAWASRILFLQARNFRKVQSRQKLRFGDEFFDAVAKRTVELSDELADRQQVLGDCIARLKPEMRDMLRRRYEDGATAKSVAESLGRSAAAIHQALSRVRKVLFDCVNRALSKPAGGSA
jgi:RNA polymerase sigma-70 factor, ECF subfamily